MRLLAGKVTLTAAVRGVPLASNAYQPRAVGRHEPGRTPEIQNVVVYLKDAAFKHTTEATLGYRMVPDLTARASYMARKAFTRTTWDHQAGVSLVWARQWW